MKGIIEKVQASWRRDASLPLSHRLQKGVRYLTASVSAPLFLGAATRVGQRPRTSGRPRIENEGTLEIGDDLLLNSEYGTVELATAPGGSLRLGNRVHLNYGASVYAAHEVTFGNDVSVGPYSVISDTEMPRGAAAPDAKAVHIGDGVWLAARVTVLPGAKIGAGSVISAGSVVSGEIPPAVLAGGIPARVLRPLVAPQPGEATVQATQSVAHAVAAAAPEPQFRGTLISDFTVDDLARALAAVQLGGEVAPFGQVIPSLLQPPSDARDFALVWTRPQGAVPSFQRVLDGERVDEATLLSEVDAFCDLVANGAAAYRFTFVPTWTVAPSVRGLGLIDTRPGGVARSLSAMNLRLMDRLAAAPKVHVLAAERWVQGGWSDKLWFLGKVPFTAQVFKEAAEDVAAAIRGLTGGARKLLVLDLDNTLWGGVVGDLGWEKLRLGGHDGVGEALVEFQREIKALTRRGIVLGIVSKNEESVALEAIRKHPAMLLREDDFAGYRINWQDKARNVADLAAELNLGLQSVVFIDDNPAERARVKEQLPEVLVPEWPEDFLRYPAALRALRCFDTPAVSKEDLERGKMYVEERKREAAKRDVGSMEEWLKSLDLRVTVEPLGPSNLTRAAQLFNKTNQMNLSTRRLTEAELLEWSKAPGRAVWAISVRDRFGDAGLTGLVGFEKDGEVGRITDWLLSCRVMGRKVEESMTFVAVDEARRVGCKRVEAVLKPTAKNKPTRDFWARSGFAESGDTYSWDCAAEYALPATTNLEVRK